MSNNYLSLCQEIQLRYSSDKPAYCQGTEIISVQYALDSLLIVLINTVTQVLKKSKGEGIITGENWREAPPE